MKKIQVYRDQRGGWSFYASQGSGKVEAELVDGYRLSEELDGLRIVGGPEKSVLKAGEAVRRGVVKIPMFWSN
jgi:hypothetical protein